MSDQKIKNKYYEIKNKAFTFYIKEKDGVKYFDSEELFLRFLNNNYELGLSPSGEICIKLKTKKGRGC